MGTLNEIENKMIAATLSSSRVIAPTKSFSRKSSSLKKSHRRNVSVNARLVGNAAPHFEGEAVIDQEFETISLDQYKGKKYVVLFFYPLDFTFVCPTEITAFSDRYEKFSKLDCEIIGCSVDSKYSHLAWIQTERNEGGLGDIEYPLLSDLKRQAVHAYDVYDENSGEALRGLFIIDKDVSFSTRPLTMRRSVALSMKR